MTIYSPGGPDTIFFLSNVILTAAAISRSKVLTEIQHHITAKQNESKPRFIEKKFWPNEASTRSAVWKLVQKVRETGMQVDNTRGPRRHTVRTDVNEDALSSVCDSILEHRLQQLNISSISLARILHKNLGLFTYKIQLPQQVKARLVPLSLLSLALKPVLNRQPFCQKIIFSDKARKCASRGLWRMAKMSYLGTGSAV